MALAFAIIALAGFASACSDDSNAEKPKSSSTYCTELPNYFKVMFESMNKNVEDPKRFDEWAAKAKQMQAIAPDELHSSWDFLVDYSGRMAANADLSSMKSDDPQRNGAAGKAVVEHGQKYCGIPK
ncbi:hypothetical protein [Nocardia macrotermitis]|uniref:hypothetical protein n=1 Tax=Nocardia macrotermitis TaxID=2585198 RepID=UPI00129560FB|nr:hypothetical protein [Nocardia macrotermitis]